MTERWLATFAAMTDLPAEDAIDRDLLIGELEASRFSETVLREDTWNPLDWVYLAGEGLFTLLAREFAPLADRLTSTAGRLEGLPAVFEAARATLVGSADRPVGRFQTETALRQLAGVEVLIADAVSAAEAASADPAVAALRPRLDAAAATARAAVAAFETHLRDVVLPASDGEGRLGAALFAEKMRHTMRSETLTPERIMAAAEREYVAIRTEMVRLARELWPVWRADAPPPADEGDARPGRARRDRRGASRSRRPARLLPRRERPDRGVLHGARTSSAWPTIRSRSSGRRSSCARSGARCSRHPDRWIGARRRSSRSPRCPTTGARSSASRTSARTTTGCSDC